MKTNRLLIFFNAYRKIAVAFIVHVGIFSYSKTIYSDTLFTLLACIFFLSSCFYLFPLLFQIFPFTFQFLSYCMLLYFEAHKQTHVAEVMLFVREDLTILILFRFFLFMFWFFFSFFSSAQMMTQVLLLHSLLMCLLCLTSTGSHALTHLFK